MSDMQHWLLPGCQPGSAHSHFERIQPQGEGCQRHLQIVSFLNSRAFFVIHGGLRLRVAARREPPVVTGGSPGEYSQPAESGVGVRGAAGSARSAGCWSTGNCSTVTR